MITLFSSDDTGEKPRLKNITKKPAFWIILTSVVLITAAVIFLPNALKTPVTSEPSSVQVVSDPYETSTGSQLIPSEGEVILLSGASPNGTYVSSLSFSGTADSAWIKDEQQLQAFFSELTANLGLNTNFSTVFSRYDKAYFKSKQLVVLIMSKTTIWTVPTADCGASTLSLMRF